jgi:uncharacterized protein YjdB
MTLKQIHIMIYKYIFGGVFMEIVFDKTKKVLLSLVLTLLFISISTTIFAADTFRLNIASATMYEGKEIELTADNQRVIWTSSDPSKATVNSSGKVRAIKKGTVTITAEKNGEKHSCEIKINKQSFIDKLRGITMNASAVTLYEGENIVLKTGQVGEWKTTNKYAAEVVTGRVNGKKPGIAIISQKVGRKTATCWVTVKKAEKIELDTEQSISGNSCFDAYLSLTIGEQKKLTVYEGRPEDYTWINCNPDIVTLNNGVVTAKAKGYAEIKLMYGSHLNGMYHINVDPDLPNIMGE